MVDAEVVLLEELERLSPLGGFEHADWADVIRRAQVGTTSSPGREREPARRRLYLAIAAALVVIAVAAPALAFRAEIVDFLTATHAPKNIVVYFARLEVEQSMPPGVGPGLFPARARRVTSLRVGDKTSVLYVAPTKRGGFCAIWGSNGAPHCVTARNHKGSYGSPANVGWSAMYPSLGVDTVEGEVFVPDATVKLLYADGAATVIPYVWVTAPIDAGFFFYEIPTSRRLGAVRPVALIVVRDGKTLARQAIEDVHTTTRLIDRQDRWGHSIQTTPEEVWSKRRLVFSFNLSDGTLVELWVMPSRQGRSRRCFAGTYVTGCEPAVLRGSTVQLSVGGTGQHAGALLRGEVARSVARVELRYEDGARQVVTPKDGWVLLQIGSRHSRPGHRLVRAIGFDRTGHAVGGSSFNPATPDVYPCLRLKNYGYGVMRCP
ncbi:MAG: hypothetical protein JWM06_2543 [Actinomycetia bacterium]|nr:hypothetical protein [Actinomycetes bacterium]